MSKDKQESNLPAIPVSNLFYKATGQEIELAADIASEITASDFTGYDAPTTKFAFVRIRQKDEKNEKGRTVRPAGNFMITDKSIDKELTDDIEGSVGLTVTLIADTHSRAFWENLTDPAPRCKSNNGIVGVGNPGGDCASCKYGRWNNDPTAAEKRPACGLNYNILAFDHNNKMIYILNLGRSGLAPLDNFKRQVDRFRIKAGGQERRVPMHFLIVRVTTAFKQNIGQYYVPEFQIVEPINDPILLRQIKDARESVMAQFRGAVAETNIPDDERHDINSDARATEYSEIPLDDKGDDNDMPF